MRAIESIASLCLAVARRCREIANRILRSELAWLAASAAAQTRTLMLSCAMRHGHAVVRGSRAGDHHRRRRCCDAQEIIGVAKKSASYRGGASSG
ncbi:hypothetical protein [Bradyrhizobium sp. NAS96.2]|uniref:hypothetical protein n=1 Tax=Bradyrhizobium sp. NAS96.2 TaxID=1680160 RepID=UPI001160E3F8|nr:hypothetical protein [Bradyrhizobium sp. NAS96.2]